MSKSVLTIVSALLLQGCVYQSIDQRDLQAAARVCGGVEHISSVTANWAGGESVLCLTGTREIRLHKNRGENGNGQ